MAKKMKVLSEAGDKPNFHPGTHVTVPSLAVDLDGTAWWVDPNTRTIEKAK